MAIDSTGPRSRRALLGAGLGALAATTVGALARPEPAQAGNPPVLLGQDNVATGTTGISTTDVDAFTGTSDSAMGLNGFSTSSFGVYGNSPSGHGVHGRSDTGEGVSGQSGKGTAVHGVSDRASGFAVALLGEANNPGGVGSLGNNYAGSGQAIGAQGTSDSPTGLASVGWARHGGLGVVGYSGSTFPSTPVKTGVLGQASQDAASVGVRGVSGPGRGGVFAGGTAQLRLVPSTAATHPGSGVLGDLFLDKAGRLWFCKGTTTWKQLA